MIPTLTDYDWIVISSSAGKDSQAMLDYVCTQADMCDVLDKVVVVHCDLGRVEWKGTAELAEHQASRYGVRYITLWRKQGDLLAHIEKMGFFPRPTTRYCTSDHKRDQIIQSFTALTSEKRSGDLLEQIEQRGMFPDPRRRYCTSDQKRAPVHKMFTALADKTRQDHNRKVRILSCQGMRAQESPARAKRLPFSIDERASNGRRQVDTWLPLHSWSVDQVWAHIKASRTADLIHYAYGLGMPRLSCVFCIFAPRAALVLAAKHNPELLDQYIAVEDKIGHRFKVDLSLREVREEARKVGEITVSDWRM